MTDHPISNAEKLFSRLNISNGINLIDSEIGVFSQNGEDGIIFEIFKRLDCLSGGTVVEFGVEDGTETCSRLLIERLGWQGLYIEADADKFANASKNFKNNAALKLVQEYVSDTNINSIVESNVIADIDLVVIDIDGLDYKIFKAMDATPKLFVVEYNASLPHDVSLVSDNMIWDGSANFGASLLALEKIANEKGYSLIHTDLCGVNAFFIRNDLIDVFPEHLSPAKRPANYDLMGSEHPGLDINSFREF